MANLQACQDKTPKVLPLSVSISPHIPSQRLLIHRPSSSFTQLTSSELTALAFSSLLGYCNPKAIFRIGHLLYRWWSVWTDRLILLAYGRQDRPRLRHMLDLDHIDALVPCQFLFESFQILVAFEEDFFWAHSQNLDSRQKMLFQFRLNQL